MLYVGASEVTALALLRLALAALAEAGPLFGALLPRPGSGCPGRCAERAHVPTSDPLKHSAGNQKPKPLVSLTHRGCCEQWAMPFNQPVNTAVYTSYLDYVPTPMDFSTVGLHLFRWHSAVGNGAMT